MGDDTVETTARSVTKSSIPCNLRTAIAHQRDHVLELDHIVAIQRTDVDRSVEALRHAVRERDRAAMHLEQLVDWAEEFEAGAETVGFWIAERHIAMPTAEAGAA